MNDDELCWMSAADLAAAIARCRVSPVEVVDAVLARIERLKALCGRARGRGRAGGLRRPETAAAAPAP